MSSADSPIGHDGWIAAAGCLWLLAVFALWRKNDMNRKGYRAIESLAIRMPA